MSCGTIEQGEVFGGIKKKKRERRERSDQLVQSPQQVPTESFYDVASSTSMVVQRERQEHLAKNSHSTKLEKRRKERKLSSPLAKELNWFRLK